jgi:hypothetical protein
VERLAEGPAGALLLYSYDVFHRGVQFTTPGASGHLWVMKSFYAALFVLCAESRV